MSAADEDVVAREVANAVELLTPVTEAVEGYRQARLRDGYLDPEARRMAVDYHGALLRFLVR